MSVLDPLARIRAEQPLLHCISNIVTANDCANLGLAVGASPMMAQDPQEVAEIAEQSGAVVLNTGTPDEDKFTAATLAGRAANATGVPVVLDPVGVGASSWRLQRIRTLLETVCPDILRVNYGEAAALLGSRAAGHGVDSMQMPDDAETRAAILAQQLHCVVLLSGTEDIITDGEELRRVAGGSDLMRSVTGAGCMLSVLCGAFASVQPDDPMNAACQASRFWKLCAARAEVAAAGAASFRVSLLDTAGRLTDADLNG